MMRVCKPGTVPKLKPPIRISAATVGTGWAATDANTTSTTVRAATKPSRVPSRDRSASRPPAQLPTNSPSPNSTSSHGTVLAANPLTSVSV
ncbi:Uncharacterised protein [Mycobacteroides abscessus subsp. abscessus]|nr:Uncharacterised protein [Mycobacteroides abscessus subsp. abscessus]